MLTVEIELFEQMIFDKSNFGTTNQCERKRCFLQHDQGKDLPIKRSAKRSADCEPRAVLRPQPGHHSQAMQDA